MINILKKYLFFFTVIFLFILSLFFSFYSTKKHNYINPVVVPSNNTITVYLQDGFKNPGVYEVPTNTTYQDIMSKYENIYNPDIHKNIDLNRPVTNGDILSLKEPTIYTNISTQKEKIDINNATLISLQNVPGIGEKKATDIYTYIQNNSPISDINSIGNVSGVGEKTLKDIKQYFY